MKLSVTAKTAIAVAVSALILIVIGSQANQQGNLQYRNAALLDQTQQIIDRIDLLSSSLGELTSAEDRASTAGDARKDYEQSATVIRAQVDHLKQTSIIDEKAINALSRDIDKRIETGRELFESGGDYQQKVAMHRQKVQKISREMNAIFSDLKRDHYNELVRSNEELQFTIINNMFGINLLMFLVFSLQIAIWLFVVRYVSERQRVEDNLADREARMRAVVDTAPDGIITVSANGNIESANIAMLEILGFKPEALIGKNVESIMTQFFANKEEYFNRKLKTGESEKVIHERELVGLRSDGTEVPLALAVSVLNLGDRRILTAIIRDITERKEAERRVSDFYSTVSHELRTPLTSIRTALGLMETGSIGKLTTKGAQLMRIARAECDRLIRLINDILDIRKIEAGKLSLKMQHTKAKVLVNNTCGNLREMATEAGVELITRDLDPGELLCDVDRIVQVLTNLISNAIHFSPKKGIVIIEAKHLPDRGFYRFDVIDHGPGIPEEQLSKIWDRFLQVDSGDGQTKGGSGLGLAITKAIVAEHGGNVGVSSRIGSGSRFWFELPDSITTSVPRVETAPVASANRVMVLSDDDEMLELLNGLLSGAGYELSRATSLAEARRLISEHKFSLVLFDVDLPDGTGFQLIANRVADRSQQPLPVIVLPGKEPETNMLGNPVLIDWLINSPDEARFKESLEQAIRRNTIEEAKVFIVSDKESSFASLERKLKALKIRASGQSDTNRVETIKETNPDLIILDIDTSDDVCFDIFRLFRQEKIQPIPLIIYAERELTEADMNKLALAFSRYLSKSHMSETEFLAAVRELLDVRLRVLHAQPR